MSSSSSVYIIFCIILFSLLTHPTFCLTTCKSLSNKTFDNCNDLPTLGAILQWTYNPSTSSLSMAFTASPPQPDGWVAWALNPTDTGMAGAQALVAYKGKPSTPITVETYDIRSYNDLKQGLISYNVSSLSAVDSSGAITIFGTWVIPKDESTVNQVWQVGPVANGKIGKHAFEAPNLGAKMKLSLTGGGAAAPGESPSASKGDSTAPAPGTGAGVRLASGVLAFGAAILVSLFV